MHGIELDPLYVDTAIRAGSDIPAPTRYTPNPAERVVSRRWSMADKDYESGPGAAISSESSP
jgi:hypothetical protein